MTGERERQLGAFLASISAPTHPRYLHNRQLIGTGLAAVLYVLVALWVSAQSGIGFYDCRLL